jgi:hypothetical protein
MYEREKSRSAKKSAKKEREKSTSAGARKRKLKSAKFKAQKRARRAPPKSAKKQARSVKKSVCPALLVIRRPETPSICIFLGFTYNVAII